MAVKIIITALIYFLSAKAVGPLSLIESESVFAIWPPAGIAFGALFLYGYRIWPGIFLGALFLNLTISPLAPSIQIALTNTLGPVIGFWFLNKFNRENIFSSLRMMMLFLIAVLVASIITATGGLFALYFHSFIEQKDIFNIWSAWFLGDFIGFLLITPIIDSIFAQSKFSKGIFSIEGIAMIFVLAFTSLFIFGPVAIFNLITYPIVYFLLPPLIWSTLRFEPRVAVMALLAVTLFSIYGTIIGYGPFIRADLNQTLLLLQSFSVVISITILTMSAIFHERDYVYQKLLKNENELKKAIVDLKKKDELILIQSRQAIMGEMISMIAHQWRQPLTTISMSANNIIADIVLDSIDLVELEKTVKIINTNTQELSKTIDDFKNFFKPNQIIESTNLEDVMNNALSVIGKTLENNNITLKFNKLEESKTISTHPRELMQVFINILNNAKDVLIEKKIMNPIITISYKHSNDENVIITISDNAGGIQENIIDNIFDPYFSTKEQKNGTGLGLYMSKMIIDKHLFGKISAYNQDSGACFQIELPYHIGNNDE